MYLTQYLDSVTCITMSSDYMNINFKRKHALEKKNDVHYYGEW